MSNEQDKKLYDTITRTGELLKLKKPAEGEEYSLESILAEYGKGAAKPAPKAPEPVVQKPVSAEIPQKTEKPLPRVEEKEAEPLPQAEEDRTPPDRVSLKDMMRSTVDAVLTEQGDAIVEPAVPLRERLKNAVRPRSDARQDTEELWAEPEEKKAEPLPPEPSPEEAFKLYRRQSKKAKRGVWAGAVPTALSLLLLVTERLGLLPEEIWQQGAALCGGAWTALMALSLLMSVGLWRRAVEKLRDHLVGPELAALLLAIVTLCQCLVSVLSGGGRDGFVPSATLALWCAQLGAYLEARSRRDAAYLVNMGGNPPYSVVATASGACKQKGKIEGFFRTLEKCSPMEKAHGYLIPLVLAATAVLSGVVALSGNTGDFLWIWSAMLSAAVPLSLSLCAIVPFARLQKRLKPCGCAVAGWWGARNIQSKSRLVLSENDIFPPGTVEFNGYKVFGEERSKMLAYAAAITEAVNSQLKDLFAQPLATEGGVHYRVNDLQFHEEGGVGGTIRGETVLMGSAYFMRHQHVALPGDVKLQTGVYLAVDNVLCAIFVIKYQVSRNVDWALRAMERNHLRPVLAVRSGNVTPGLLRRKFGTEVHAVYPDVTTRVALSDAMENTAENADTALYREGLMPLVETAVGTKKMLRATRQSVILSYLSAIAGLLLSYYFTSAGAYDVLTAVNMAGFGLLWLLPTVLLSGMVKHF